jgi:hypothetical protein
MQSTVVTTVAIIALGIGTQVDRFSPRKWGLSCEPAPPPPTSYSLLPNPYFRRSVHEQELTTMDENTNAEAQSFNVFPLNPFNPLGHFRRRLCTWFQVGFC